MDIAVAFDVWPSGAGAVHLMLPLKGTKHMVKHMQGRAGAMLRQYVLTGAPGSGKTVLGAELRERGYEVVAEAATDVIAAQQALGVDEPWLHDGFIEAITALQQRRERQAPIARHGVRFFDRSPLCTIALARYLGWAVPRVLAAEAARVVEREVYQSEVFLVRPLGFVTGTPARRISYDQSLIFETIHQQVYHEHGFQLIDVPAAAVPQRADFIESRLRIPSDTVS